MSLDAPHLVRLQVELEYQVNPAGHLLPFPGSDEQAKFIVYRTAQDFERFFRHDLPETTRTALIEADRWYRAVQAMRRITGLSEPDETMPQAALAPILAVAGVLDFPAIIARMEVEARVVRTAFIRHLGDPDRNMET